jgi:hypothetical protein
MRWIFDGVKKAPQPGEFAIGRLGARWRRRQQRGGQAEQQKAAERARGAQTRQRARLEMDWPTSARAIDYLIRQLDL